MSKGIIIAGFATCGKSILGKKYSNVIDLESSPFKHIMNDNLSIEEQKGTKRESNPLWPQNYYTPNAPHPQCARSFNPWNCSVVPVFMVGLESV